MFKKILIAVAFIMSLAVVVATCEVYECKELIAQCSKDQCSKQEKIVCRACVYSQEKGL